MIPKPGDRVCLIRSTDSYTKLQPGTRGTVTLVDAMGTVHVNWDDGSRLGLIPEEDAWSTVCCECSDPGPYDPKCRCTECGCASMNYDPCECGAPDVPGHTHYEEE